ncbi:MAG: sugar transferase [Candidatus Latescibacterota bacterium]|jgi:exopolysaccharide biosynthesis polyprenyl glycosylphosphotransferase|nr:MAG: sugar transferase [Candidatus Latescibacterota bacterium]
MAGSPELHEAVYSKEPIASIIELKLSRPNRAYSALKRLTDIVIAGFLLLLFLPIIPVVALLIRLDSPGPILFKQRRVGKGGKPFNFYKFRSMVTGAEGAIDTLRPLSGVDGPVFKIKDDPRITHVGRFLRRSSLDELPQLINVLRGEMSIVGPRPNLPCEVSQYLPWQRRRLDVTPGITCFWQIAGRSHIGFQEWMRLDLEYVRKRSYVTDLKIMVQTLPAVIARKGAY